MTRKETYIFKVRNRLSWTIPLKKILSFGLYFNVTYKSYMFWNWEGNCIRTVTNVMIEDPGSWVKNVYFFKILEFLDDFINDLWTSCIYYFKLKEFLKFLAAIFTTKTSVNAKCENLFHILNQHGISNN